MRVNRRPNQWGMSLLEVMVALSIFSIIGLASYQVLSSVMAANVAVKNSADGLQRLQKSFAQMERDMEQLVDRTVRVSDELFSEALLISEQGQQIEMSRGGRANPLQFSRSNLVRVRYDIGIDPHRGQGDSARSVANSRDTQTYLRRLSWSVLDRSSEGKPRIQVLIPIDSLSLSAITNKGHHDIWPPKKLADDEQLQALSIAIEHQTLGELIRLIKVY